MQGYCVYVLDLAADDQAPGPPDDVNRRAADTVTTSQHRITHATWESDSLSTRKVTAYAVFLQGA
jgi:hypothetical protein